MTNLLAILASTSAWINIITPESSLFFTILFPYACIYPLCTQILPLPSCINCNIVVKIFCRHGRDECPKVCYTNDIARSITNIAAAFYHKRISWKQVCPYSRYATDGGSYISPTDVIFCMNCCNSTVPHKVPNLSSSADSQCCNKFMPCRGTSSQCSISPAPMISWCFLAC